MYLPLIQIELSISEQLYRILHAFINVQSRNQSPEFLRIVLILFLITISVFMIFPCFSLADFHCTPTDNPIGCWNCLLHLLADDRSAIRVHHMRHTAGVARG